MPQIAVRKFIGTTTGLSTAVHKNGDTGVDITKHTLVVFDGSTAGGIPLALESHTHPNATNSVTGFMTAADHVYLYTHTHALVTGSVAGFMSAADKLKLDGIPPGGGGGGGGATEISSSVPNTVVLRDANADFAAHDITAHKFIGPLNGNADTVTNGVVTSGSYANPSWITSIDGAKITGTIPGTVTFAGTVAWTNVTGRPTLLSQFTNDPGFINGAGNTTGTSGGVLSTGGRETASPTANTVIIRDSGGKAQVATPVASGDIANKAYVDAQLSGTRKTVFISNGTFTVPSNVNLVKVLIISGGAGGTSVNGGGAGGVFYGEVEVTPSASVAVVVGAGGAANSNGGDSSFGTLNVTGGGTSGFGGSLYGHGVGNESGGSFFVVSGGGGQSIGAGSSGGNAGAANPSITGGGAAPSTGPAISLGAGSGGAAGTGGNFYGGGGGTLAAGAAGHVVVFY